MSTDLVPTIVHPLTGEAFALPDLTDALLARLLEDVKEYEWRLRNVKRAVSDEALRRMDRTASWTLHAGEGFTLKGASPAPVEQFDVVALRTDLAQLVADGLISDEAMNNAVEEIVDYKARKRGIDALRKLGGIVAETVNRHASNVEKQRYVSVERSA